MLRMTTITASRKQKAQNQVVKLRDADHASSALHFREGEDGVGVDHQGVHYDGEPQGGDAEVVAAQGEDRKSEQEADFGGEGAGQEHGQQVHHLERQSMGQNPRHFGEYRASASEAGSTQRPTLTAI